MDVLPECMSACMLCTTCMQCTQTAEEADVRSPRTQLTDNCEALSECWVLNMGWLEDQPVL